jgi:biopolymer transport protein TolQ
MSDTVIQEAVTIQHSNLSIIDLILSADFTGKAVIVTLLIMSIWSWTIILQKYFSYRSIKHKIAKFEATFWSGQILDQLYEYVKRSVDNPLAAIFVSAMNECKRKNTVQSDSVLKIGIKDRVLQSMYLIKNRELESLEEHLSFLAVVGSTAPFIGLFGTVWGIMNSFQSIAASNNTSLSVVAPGIAEALLATAIGLLAAIPAVMCYNLLASHVNKLNNKFDDFINELNTLLSRAIDEGKI